MQESACEDATSRSIASHLREGLFDMAGQVYHSALLLRVLFHFRLHVLVLYCLDLLSSFRLHTVDRTSRLDASRGARPGR